MHTRPRLAASLVALLMALAAVVGSTAPAAALRSPGSGESSWSQAGVYEPEEPAVVATAYPTSINCWSDLDCFMQAAATCDAARLTWQTTLDFFGISSVPTTLLELKGLQSDQCRLYVKVEHVDVRFSDWLVQQMLADGASYEEIAQAEWEADQQATLYEGLDGTCTFSVDALTAMLLRWKYFGLTNADLGAGDCEGPIFDSLGLVWLVP